MWKFIDLTHEEKALRRQNLDAYAQAAQLSALIPLLLILLLSVAKSSKRKYWPHDDAFDPPGSPYVKNGRSSPLGVKVAWRRFRWWCGDEVRLGAWRVGVKGEVLGGAVWTIWLAYLSMADTGDDYLHFTKRLGIIAGSQLPLQYLLAVKGNASPITLIFRVPVAHTLVIHQALGRIIAIFMYGHAILYLNFYIQSSILLSKIVQFYVICGILAVLAFTAINITSLPTLRSYSYRLFYTVHVICASALFPLLWFHVSHIRIYLYESLAIYLFSSAIRKYSTTTYRDGTIRLVPGTNLMEICVPELLRTTLAHSNWHPGQHAYVSIPGKPFLRTLRSNPFTFATIPSKDHRLQFYARVLSGRTARLALQASGSSVPVSVEGPYGTANHGENLLGCGRVLFVAGGIGATFVVPLYRQLLSDLSPSPGSARRDKVKFVWAVKNKNEAAWAVKIGGVGFKDRLNLFVTGGGAITAAGSSRREFVAGEESRPGRESIALEERKNLMDEEESVAKELDGIDIHSGRPDLGREVEELFSHGGDERIAVVVCGPKSLAVSLRSHIAPWVKRGRDVMFVEETFGN